MFDAVETKEANKPRRLLDHSPQSYLLCVCVSVFYTHLDTMVKTDQRPSKGRSPAKSRQRNPDRGGGGAAKHQRKRKQQPPPRPRNSNQQPAASKKAPGGKAHAKATGSPSAMGTPQKIISKQDILKLPPIAWKGPVQILKKKAEMEAVVERLLQEDVLGFDTESKPVFRKGDYQPPALVQLADKQCVYLFQVLRGGLDILKPLFEAEHVLKVGVSVDGDVKGLQKVLPFTPGGFVELSKRTQALGYVNGGLRGLAAILLGGALSKKAKMSNWAKPILDDKQVEYAATDAWIGRELYFRVLEEERERSDGKV
eukprot:scaffold244_cov172-Amphora_coffeaeformis.AAC.19